MFFVLMDNDHVDDFVLLESSNEMAKWSGSENAPPGESAFQGTNFGSGGAAGQKGRDGDVWKVRKK